MSTAIAIFVKTPCISPVKTRLAKTIGKENTKEFYRLSLNAIAKTAQQSNAKIYWAVAEKEGLNNSLWQGFETIHTGEGALGERQYNIYTALLEQHDRVILIGADAPQISPHIIKQAIEALDNHGFVIGPANDGGYYLFGGRAGVDLYIWNSVPWSTETTRETLEKLLPSKPIHLEFLTDVDTQYNLHHAIDEMPKTMSNEQQQIVEWVDKL